MGGVIYGDDEVTICRLLPVSFGLRCALGVSFLTTDGAGCGNRFLSNWLTGIETFSQAVDTVVHLSLSSFLHDFSNHPKSISRKSSGICVIQSSLGVQVWVILNRAAQRIPYGWSCLNPGGGTRSVSRKSSGVCIIQSSLGVQVQVWAIPSLDRAVQGILYGWSCLSPGGRTWSSRPACWIAPYHNASAPCHNVQLRSSNASK